MKWIDSDGVPVCMTPIGEASLEKVSETHYQVWLAGRIVCCGDKSPEDAIYCLKHHLMSKYFELGNFIENNYE